MPDVLIRSVPDDDLDQIRVAAAEQGTSVQAYLRNALHAQASYLRRQEGLARTADRLRDRPAVSAEDRSAVLEAIAAAHAERADHLIDRSDA